MPKSDSNPANSAETGRVVAEKRRGDEPLPKSVVAGVAIGQGGMSILYNLLAFLLVFFYLPPDDAGLPQLVSGTTYLVVLNAVVLIAAAGRALDAITDPLIATLSDRSTHRRGRRIPFMAVSAVPAALATFAMFTPPVQSGESGWNIVWLLVVQAILYLALTAYVTPCFSLVVDLGRDANERLDLATWTAVTWALGLVIAAMAPFLAGLFEPAMSTIRAWQTAVGILCVVAVIFMFVPIFTVDEKRWARSEAATVPLRQIYNIISSNRFFRYYVAADFAYFGGLIIIQTGLLYYLTVLLEVDGALTAPLLLLMIVVSTTLYPFINRRAKVGSGKRIIMIAFLIAAFDFGLIIILGRLPIPGLAQAIGVVLIYALSFSALSFLPQWVLTDIAEHSTLKSGVATNASFFAARTFLQKIAQTFGVVIFALLTTFGRNPGDDLGIRLSGIAGMVLCLAAAWVFRGYDETILKRELAEMSEAERAIAAQPQLPSPNSR